MTVTASAATELSALVSALRETELFGSLAGRALRALAKSLERIPVAAGTVVMREGDIGDAMYVVAAGRLRLVVGETTVGELATGQVAGELALLSDRPRVATVVASRDSVLLRLSTAAFTVLSEQHPEIVLALARRVAERVTPVAADGNPQANAVRTVAVLAAGGTAPVDVRMVADQLARAVPGRTRVISRRSLDRVGARGDADVAAALDRIERAHRFVVYVTDPTDEAWTRRCLRQADRVVLVGRARADATPNETERELPRATAVELVLIQQADAALPGGTSAWLDPRPAVVAHHHVRANDVAGYARVARRLLGRSVALVLGGGGPRGLAHLGVLQALEEAGVPVDAIGGTSIGALMGLSYAMGWDHQTRLAMAEEGFGRTRFLIGMTLPVVSISSGAKLTKLLRTYFADTAIEDLWTPWFAVSTSLSRGDAVVHERGPAWWAVRASIALPGILPPVWDAGDLLVDGGLISNLPVDTMQQRVRGQIIAVDLEPADEECSYSHFGPTLSGWRAAAERLRPRRRTAVPNLAQILLRSKDVGVRRRQQDEVAGVSLALHLRPAMTSGGPLDFRGALPLIDVGYRHTLEALEHADVTI